jgi:uncharacterized protein (DUF924 family)
MTKDPASIVDPEVILSFWFGELDEHGRVDQATQARWWSKDAALDAEICQRFSAAHAGAELGSPQHARAWPTSQCSINFRGTCFETLQVCSPPMSWRCALR